MADARRGLALFISLGLARGAAHAQRHRGLALGAALAVAGCGHGEVGALGLELSLSRPELRLPTSRSEILALELRSQDAAPLALTLHLEAPDGGPLPGWLTPSFDPPELVLPPRGSASAHLIVTAQSGTPDQRVPLRIVARSQGRSQHAAFTLAVRDTPPPAAGWQRQIGTAGTEQLAALTVDPSGQVLVVGSTSVAFGTAQNQGDYDGFLLKYAPSGALLWAAMVATRASDVVTAVATDAAGQAVVGGYTYGTFPEQVRAGLADAFVACYARDGRRLWLRQLGTDQIDKITGVAIDTSGAVYAVGTTEGTLPGQQRAGGVDLFALKLDPHGTELWRTQLGSEKDERGGGAAVGTDGALYLAAATSGAFLGAPALGAADAALVRLHPGGTLDWLRVFGTAGEDALAAVTADPAGGVYAVGVASGSLAGQGHGSGQDALIVRYAADGTRTFAHQFGTSSADALSAVTVVDGVVYTAGVTRGSFFGESPVSQDVFLARHGESGTPDWLRQLGTHQLDTATALGGAPGRLYLGGVTFSAFGDQVPLGDSDGYLQLLHIDP